MFLPQEVLKLTIELLLIEWVSERVFNTPGHWLQLQTNLTRWIVLVCGETRKLKAGEEVAVVSEKHVQQLNTL